MKDLKNDELKNNLLVAMRLLNQVSVSGKQNLMNLAGAMDIIEQVLSAIEEVRKEE